MADINNPITFDKKQTGFVSAKLNDKSFSHKDWGNEDLLELRKLIRNHYRKIQKGICAYCKNTVSLRSASNAHVEHIVPKSKYIKFIFEPKNLCVICADCNEIKRELEVLNQEEDPLSKKYKRYPRSSGSFKLVHPHFDVYEEHIFRIGDFYIDISSKGAFTLFACRLNRRAHKFGIEPTLLSETELIQLMNKFSNEVDFSKRQIIFKKLQDYFIKI